MVPIENTILYVEPVYQTMLNEKSDIPVLKKVIVASGNKVAIGDNLNLALQKLLSQYAVDIEVENTDDIQGLIEAIIKANNNLTQSNENQNWEMMGKDIQKLQTLINSLEEMENKEIKKAKVEYDKINQDERERELAELRLKYIRDQNAIRDYGYDRGKEEGIKNEKINIAKVMLKRNIPIKEIIEITGLKEDEIKKLK